MGETTILDTAGTAEDGEGLSRRALLAAGAVAAGGLTLGSGSTLVRRALAAPAGKGAGPYGPLQAADANGVQLPEGFESREIARSLLPVPGTSYQLPVFPDGQATYRTGDGGWILVTNSESVAQFGAGTSAIRFDRGGRVTDAYRILGDTNTNCAGGPTPWGTWLSGEESEDGMIWECDPAGRLQAEPRPLLGVFKHEAAAVDPVQGRVYLTEDDGSGCFYRFTPDQYPSLDSGVLEAAIVAEDGAVRWRQVPDPTTAETGTPTQDQVDGATRFSGGEGIWHARGVCYFTTKGDKRVWAYDIRERRLEVIYDHEQSSDASLDAVDNVTVTAVGDVYVCEDGGNLEIGLISEENTVSPFLRLPGEEHSQSEICGACFDPSGTRLYFTSQRAGFGVGPVPGPGVIYEVTGPFRLPRGGQPDDFIFGPPAGEARPEGPLNPGPDTDGPRLRVKSRKRISVRRLRRRGLPLKLRTGEPAQLAVSLRSSDLRADRDPGGGADRPRSTRLAQLGLGELRAESGGIRVRHDLELSKRGKRRLRRLKQRRTTIDARLVAVAVDGSGNRTTMVRKVEIRR